MTDFNSAPETGTMREKEQKEEGGWEREAFPETPRGISVFGLC